MVGGESPPFFCRDMDVIAQDSRASPDSASKPGSRNNSGIHTDMFNPSHGCNLFMGYCAH